MPQFNFGQVIIAALENEQKMKAQEKTGAENTVRWNQQAKWHEDEVARQIERDKLSFQWHEDEVARQKAKDADILKQQEINNPLVKGEDLTAWGKAIGIELGGSPSSIASFANPDSIAAKHNNPLNLKYAGQAGATPGQDASDGGQYAKFDSVQAGIGAAAAQLQAKSFKDLTLDAALKKWSHGGYGAEVVKGVDSDKTMKNLSSDELANVINGMSTAEGSTKGDLIGEAHPELFPNGVRANDLLKLLQMREANDKSAADRATKELVARIQAEAREAGNNKVQKSADEKAGYKALGGIPTSSLPETVPQQGLLSKLGGGLNTLAGNLFEAVTTPGGPLPGSQPTGTTGTEYLSRLFSDSSAKDATQSSFNTSATQLQQRSNQLLALRALAPSDAVAKAAFDHKNQIDTYLKMASEQGITLDAKVKKALTDQATQLEEMYTSSRAPQELNVQDQIAKILGTKIPEMQFGYDLKHQ